MNRRHNKVRTLVLGGTNFIGRRIVQTLLAHDDVTVLNRGRNRVFGDRVHQLTADRDDPDSVHAALEAGFDAVVDVSATMPPQIASTASLLRKYGVDRYIFISSGAVYDSTTTSVPYPENAPIPGDAVWGPYGSAKADCEALLRGYGFEELTILRPPYVYGPGNNEQREQFLWARMLARKPIFVPGAGTTPIQFCHVDHLADIVAEACRGSLAVGTYNVGESRSYTLNEYVDVLRNAAAEPSADIRHVLDPSIPAREYFPFRNYSLVLDTTAIENATAAAAPPLLEGLIGTFRWFSEHGGLDYAPTPRELELMEIAERADQ